MTTKQINRAQLQFDQAWASLLQVSILDPRFERLQAAVDFERDRHEVFPKPEDTFAAFQLTKIEKLRVVILGQDPYHGPGQAHGLCFSVPNSVPIPPSLRNIFRELADDLKVPLRTNGDLSDWARQGVLLLNSILTVRSGEPLSHQHLEWEWFTDQVIAQLSLQLQPCVFVLWGNSAQKKSPLISGGHSIVKAPHPSPLSAHRGFFGSRPLSEITHRLRSLAREPIDWVTTE